MAIYHLHMQTISRSDGRSAVAAAAYRSASRLMDQHGTVYDYRRKAGVEQGHIIVPQGFPTMNRQSLWCMVEVAEKRKNSTLCRELDVALPIECDRKEQREIVIQFCSWLTEKWQIAVDFNLHYPMNAENPENPHAHIQFTTRRYGFDGKLGEKTRELDDLKTRTDCLLEIREQWAGLCNQRLARFGISIDHRSYATQCIEQVPGIHLGSSVTAMKRKGMRTDREDEQQQIERVNRARKILMEEEQNVRSDLAAVGETVCEPDATAGIRPDLEANRHGDAGNFDGNLGSKDTCPSDGDGGRATIQGCGGDDRSAGGAGGGSRPAEVGGQNSACPVEIAATIKDLKAALLDLRQVMFHRVDRANTDLIHHTNMQRSIRVSLQCVHSTCLQIRKNFYKRIDRKNAQYLARKVKAIAPQQLHIPDGYSEAAGIAENIQRELRQIIQHIYAHVDDANLRAIVEQPEKQVAAKQLKKRQRM